MKRFLRWLYVRLPRKIRVWTNSIRARRKLRALGKFRAANGQLGIKVYRGLGSRAAERAGVSLRTLLAMPPAFKQSLLEEAKASATAEFPDVGPNTVTDAGVAYLVDNWLDNSRNIVNMNYHAMGVGGSPPGVPEVTATALVTEVEFRAVGAKSKPAANQLRTVATIVASAPRTVNEWGLFSLLGLGTMWSTRWFEAISLDAGDAIEFTYTFNMPSFTA